MPSTTGVISYPIPPYQNLPIEPQNYQPSRFVISAISLGQTTTVTTTGNVNYVIGQLVRLLIPSAFGTIELNEQSGYVLSIPTPNQVVLGINSSRMTAFNSSATATTSQPQILATGDVNTGTVSTTGRSIPTINGNTNIAIPGSFINISPQ